MTNVEFVGNIASLKIKYMKCHYVLETVLLLWNYEKEKHYKKIDIKLYLFFLIIVWLVWWLTYTNKNFNN